MKILKKFLVMIRNFSFKLVKMIILNQKDVMIPETFSLDTNKIMP
jgi:hypothetical protein